MARINIFPRISVSNYLLFLIIQCHNICWTICCQRAISAVALPNDALNDLDKAQQLDPSNKYALLIRAKALLSLGNLEQAWDDLKEYMAAEPNDIDAYAARAGIYEKNGRIRAAARDFAKALEISFKMLSNY